MALQSAAESLTAIFKGMERPLPEVDGEGRAALVSLRRSRLTLALDVFENGCRRPAKLWPCSRPRLHLSFSR